MRVTAQELGLFVYFANFHIAPKKRVHFKETVQVKIIHNTALKRIRDPKDEYEVPLKVGVVQACSEIPRYFAHIEGFFSDLPVAGRVPIQ